MLIRQAKSIDPFKRLVRLIYFLRHFVKILGTVLELQSLATKHWAITRVIRVLQGHNIFKIEHCTLTVQTPFGIQQIQEQLNNRVLKFTILFFDLMLSVLDSTVLLFFTQFL